MQRKGPEMTQKTRSMRRLSIIAAMALAAGYAGSASAQEDPPVPNGGAASANERITQVIVYGDDPCKPSSADEIVVCVRRAEKERFRIPPNLRGDPTNPRNQSWLNRARAIEYVGRSGSQSCSPSGAAGFSGCFAKIARDAKEERKQLGDASWADLVAAERAKRLGNLDKESEEIEARVKAEEAAEAAKRQGTAGEQK